MLDYGRYQVLGTLIDTVDYEAAAARILYAAHYRQPLSVCALPVASVISGVRDPQHNYRLNQLDLALADGQPVRWALQWLHGVKLPERVYGPTLMLDVCEACAKQGLPIFLYGNTAELLPVLSEKLCSRFPALQIAGVQAGYYRPMTLAEDQALIAAIKHSQARVVFVGLGGQRQETWIYEHHLSLAMPLIGVGAAFDFHAERLRQASTWMQAHGLEWLFRLSQEPRRLWRRYLLGNPLYLLLLLLQLLKLYQPPLALTPPGITRVG